MVYQLQKWMDSVAGQTFMNYAYSWGAAVVILGTLFKLTHLPGANLMLFIGMGTEVFVFFISAFDRPFDKTADGMDLATDTQLEAERMAAEAVVTTDKDGDPMTSVVFGTNMIGASPVVIGGAPVAGGGNAVAEGTAVTEGNAPAGEGTLVTEGNAPANTPVIVGGSPVIGAPAPAVTPETAKDMEEATTTYIDRLNELNELLLKVAAQSDRLTTDSEEMENLNRTLTGISRVYEMQLKSASQQMATQDQINEQTRRMAEQIQELNAIYARMIEAMTVNMPNAAK